MKSHFFKKIVSIILCLAIFICALTSNVFAATIYLPNWECDTSYEIHYWPTLPTTVYSYVFSGMPSHICQNVQNAISQWNTGMNFSMNYYESTSQSANSTNIKIFSGYKEDLLAIGCFNAGDINHSQVAGVTSCSRVLVTTDSYKLRNGTSIRVLKISKASIAICNFSEKYMSSGYNDYQSVISHEMGHAMGWYGHSNSDDLLMYKGDVIQTAPTESDIRHVKQMYN